MSSQIKPFICMAGIIAACGMFGFFVSTKISERSPIAAEVDALELAVKGQSPKLTYRQEAVRNYGYCMDVAIDKAACKQELHQTIRGLGNLVDTVPANR